MNLVTGRQLTDVLDTFARVALFDRALAEDAAIRDEPGTAGVGYFVPEPPTALVERLLEHRIPVFVGRCVVATATPHAPIVLTALQAMGLAWHVILNRGAAIALPPHVTDADSLTAALHTLRVPRQEGAGTSGNDETFLRQCGLAVTAAEAVSSGQDGNEAVTLYPGRTRLIALS